jgi:hypothetical protein
MALQWLQVRVNPITAVRSAHVHTVRLGMTPERRHSLVRGFAVTILGISCLDLVATISK